MTEVWSGKQWMNAARLFHSQVRTGLTLFPLLGNRNVKIVRILVMFLMWYFGINRILLLQWLQVTNFPTSMPQPGF